MSGIIGKKLGMTQIFEASGVVVPVTVVEAGPCAVVQVRTPEKEGYQAVQLGFGEQKILILTAGPNENVFRSARNLQNVQVLPFREVSAYEVLNARQVLIEAEALRPAEEVVNA